MERCSLQDAAARVRADDRLVVPLGPGQPVGFLHALGERDDLAGLTVFSALLMDAFALFAKPGVRLRSGFFGPLERALRSAGHDVEFVPADFRRFAAIARRLQPRVMATSAAAPDPVGGVSLSLHAGATVDELRRCGEDPERLLIVETSPHYPRTLGLPPEHTHRLDPSCIDLLVESDRTPLELPDGVPSEIEHAIAAHVRRFVPDGATLQTGIGAVPTEIVKLLAEGSGGDYGVHSEMFTTGLMHLHQSGKVTNRKGAFEGVSVATFALGTRELYDWLDGNEDVRFLPVDVVNAAAQMGRNRSMVSINGALCVDLAGQIAADSIGGRQYSGIGGHEDFIAGAGLADGGRSLVCLPSTAEVAGRRESRILRGLPEGTPVTTPRHQVDVVVTEYGAAELAGLTERERATALTEIAHPDWRASLRD